MAPAISILMPVKNAGRTVAAAIQSFTDQSWADKELIIADGDSTDATHELLNSLAERTDVRILRAADSSATEALMRAAAAARGDVIGMVMADDWLAPEALARVGAAFAADPSLDVVSGRARLIDETSEAATATQDIPARDIGLDVTPILGTPYCGAFFFRTACWRALGGFSSAYRYGADRDFLMRGYLARLKATRIETPLYIYRKHAGSDTLVENEAVVRAFLVDHLHMAQSWLAHPNITAPESARVRSWRREQAVELALRRLRSGEAGGALGVLASQSVADPLTLATFTLRAFAHGAAKLSGGAARLPSA
jgi:glycosyltransferase involved in cell wall biosynthesis